MAENAITFISEATERPLVWAATRTTFEVTEDEPVAWDFSDILPELKQEREDEVPARFFFWKRIEFRGADLLLPFGIPTFALDDLRDEPLYEAAPHPLVKEYLLATGGQEEVPYELVFPHKTGQVDGFVVGESPPTMILS